jgi:hypothetical protein
MHSLSLLHLRPVIVPEQVEERMDERLTPLLSDDLWADDRIAELSRKPVGDLFALIDREREHVGGLVDPQVLSLQAPNLVRPDEMDAELSVLDAFPREYALRERDRFRLVDFLPASVVDLDRNHQRLRWVPVSSAWRL